MQTTQVHLKSPNLKDRDRQKIQNIKPDFALVFGDIKAINDPNYLKAINELLGDTPTCGCSTSGEITEKGRFDESIVIQGVKFDGSDSKAKVVSTDDRTATTDYEASKKLAKSLVAPDLKAVLVFAPSVEASPPAIVKGVKDAVGESVVVAGGLAGDGAQFQSSTIFVDGHVVDSGLALVGLYGSGVELSHGAFGGWKSFGGAREVTKAEGAVVYELDRRPALEVYKEALGEHAERLPDNGLMFPFAILNKDADDTGLIRAVFTVNEEDQSIVLAGDMSNGAKIKFMRATNVNLVDGAKWAAEKAAGAGKRDSLILAISCVARKLIMGEAVDDEIEAVRDTIGNNSSIVGFYAHGEIGPFFTSTDCQLHNQTMTVAVIREST